MWVWVGCARHQRPLRLLRGAVVGHGPRNRRHLDTDGYVVTCWSQCVVKKAGGCDFFCFALQGWQKEQKRSTFDTTQISQEAQQKSTTGRHNASRLQPQLPVGYEHYCSGAAPPGLAAAAGVGAWTDTRIRKRTNG